MKMKKMSNLNRSLLAKICVLLLVVSTLALGLKTFVAAKDKEAPKEKTASEAGHGDLSAKLEELIKTSEANAARWGVNIVSMSDGATVYDHNGDKLFTPASNMKIYTTAVALDLLGVDYRWRTSVYANAQPDANGRVQGDLILYGRGSPDLVATSKDPDRPSLAKLVDDLYSRGVRSVSGNVIGDESYFRGDPIGDGWQWTDMQWYYGAEASALSINGNEVDLNFVPSSGENGEARTTDTEHYVTVENRMALKSSSGGSTVGIHRGLSDNNIQIWGEVPPGSKGFGARLSVHQPALWAAKLFAHALQSRGIQVNGQVVLRDARVAATERFDPSRAVELAAVQSRPLAEIVKETNKESNNLYAELILRTIGRERGAMTSASTSGERERGDDELGIDIVRVWLSRNGIPTDRLALHDGCGLSRLDLVTPQASVRLLQAIAKTNSAAAFKDSLPIAGRDGTLGGRLKTLTDKVAAKTGSLTYDNSLAGYFTTDDGKTLVFSIMCNDHLEHGEGIPIIDKILTLLGEATNTTTQTDKNPR